MLIMSTLSEEQRRRIEENKQRALAIRAAKFSSGTANISAPQLNCISKTNIPSPNATTSKSNSYFSNIKKEVLNNNLVNYKTVNSNYSTLPVQKTTYSSNQNNLSKFKKSSNCGKGEPVTVTFSLFSKNRFCVEFMFNKIVIEILKTIPSKVYDPKTARWHFPLREYNNVKTALQSCTEVSIAIRSLPNYIVKTFILHPKAAVDYKTIDISRIHKSLQSNLYPFQKEGVQFGISKNGRCIIADDMGLGKTIQALGIAHYYASDWPLLIVCPSSMRYQWEEEIRNNIPDIPITKLFVMSTSKEQIHNPLIVITSFDLMSRCESTLLTFRFGVIIMDESHSLKNMKTNRTKAALSLIGKAERCILLSGTPALSRPIELYPQIKAIEPHAFSMKEFGLRYCDAKEGKFGWDYSGSSNMDELKLLLEERFMIRRLKSMVLEQLPLKIRQIVILDKEVVKPESKKMTAFASKMNDETVKGIEKRGTLLQYFAETSKTKLKAVKDYIIQILETENKFLIFAHHKEMMNEICQLLEDKRTYYIRIDGATNSEERKSVCDQFQFEDKFRVAVLSITAASTGLTLTAANLVIFAELYWNPGVLTQAEDRVHRIGQQDSVLVQYLIAKGTADDYIWPLVKSKLGILNQAGLSKDNFDCERTNVITPNNQKTIDDYFGDMEDYALSQIIEEVEEIENKRIKLS